MHVWDGWRERERENKKKHNKKDMSTKVLRDRCSMHMNGKGIRSLPKGTACLNKKKKTTGEWAFHRLCVTGSSCHLKEFGTALTMPGLHSRELVVGALQSSRAV